MTTVASRTFRSTPHRDATETWSAIVDLLTQGKDGDARRELRAVAGIAASLIADQAPKAAPIVVTCDGPRTRIYCLYDDDAIDGSDASEDALGFDPLKGDWQVSLPCPEDDLSWVQAALKKHSNRITARDLATGIASRPGQRNELAVVDARREGFPEIMTSVAVYTYTHSVTYVADNILKSLKDIIRLSGLDPVEFVEGWASNMLAVQTWLDSDDLERVVLEIFNPRTDELITRWDIDIVYSWSSGDGSFWTDTDQLKYAIRKAGLLPSQASYELLLKTKPGRPDVHGWVKGSFRSTDGMVRQSLGSTIEHSGLGAQRCLLEEPLMLTIDEAFRKFKSSLN